MSRDLVISKPARTRGTRDEVHRQLNSTREALRVSALNCLFLKKTPRGAPELNAAGCRWPQFADAARLWHHKLESIFGAVRMTQGVVRWLASANLDRLVLGRIEDTFCKQIVVLVGIAI